MSWRSVKKETYKGHLKNRTSLINPCTLSPISLSLSLSLSLGSLKLCLQQKNLTGDSLHFSRLTNVFTLQLNREDLLIKSLTFDLCSCLCRLDWMYGVNTSKSNGSTKLCSCSSRLFTLAASFSYMYTHIHAHIYIHGTECAHIWPRHIIDRRRADTTYKNWSHYGVYTCAYMIQHTVYIR